MEYEAKLPGKQYLSARLDNFIAVDKTLTKEGACAEAKATGDAIAKLRKEASEALDAHKQNENNPHGVTASQVGARPDTWLPTLADIGAAPAGYGLGGAAVRTEDWNTTYDNGFYFGITNSPDESWWYGYVVRDGADTNRITQTVYRNGNICTRTGTLSNMGAWVDCSPSAFAPAGYGFGENLMVEGRSVLATWGETFESVCNKIDAILETMESYTSKLIVIRSGLFYGDFYQNSGNCQALLYKGATPSVATVGATYDWRMLKIGGVWQEPEWINPPMAVGVEYRTTERWNGKPVYKQLINGGGLPAAGSVNISIPSSGTIDYIISAKGSVTAQRVFPSGKVAGGMSIDLETHSGGIDVYTSHDWLGGAPFYVTAEYTLV